MAEMDDAKKCALLAQLVGWKYESGILCHENEKTLWGYDFGGCTYAKGNYPNLYDSVNMALAWDVLVWGYKHLPQQGWSPLGSRVMEPEIENWIIDMASAGGLFDLPALEAQRVWLDKVLEMATVAGLLK